MKRSRQLCGVFLACVFAMVGLLAQSPAPNVSLPAPGTWMPVPNSALDKSGQLPVPKPLGDSGYSAIETAWSGGCYDAPRRRMLITGGGHGDYAGNEIYAFPLDMLKWQRIWGPTPNDQIQPLPASPLTPPTYLNGDPRQVHTYSGIACYGDTFWRHGGSVWSGSGGFTPSTWKFDLGHDSTWTRLADFSGPYIPTAAYDVKTGHVFVHSYNLLYDYDPLTDVATKRSTQSAGYSPAAAVDIDQDTRRFVFIGDKSGQAAAAVYWYQLDQTGLVTLHVNQPTTGDTQVLVDAATGHNRPGLTWDSRAHRLTAWNGGPFLYTLDTTTWVWTQHTMSATNAPGATISGGVYARFKYLPEYDAFILFNGISAPVYLARIDDAPVAPIAPAKPIVTQIALPTDGTWQAVKLSDPVYAKGTIPGTTKHVSVGYNPIDGRDYLTAGDYSESLADTGIGALSSYRQETWSLSLKDRFATLADPTAGWRKEYAYCGPVGQVQPKWPDFGGFHWDASRNLFWLVLGVAEMGSTTPCPGETADKVDNPGFSRGHVMTYDPVKKQWANAGPLGPAFTKVWDTVYDAGSDTLVTVRQGSSAGDVFLDRFSPATSTWSSQHVFAQPAIKKTLYGMKGYGALDAATRTLYYIEPYYVHLMAVNLATSALSDLGPLPTLAADGKTPVVMDSGNEPKIAWDSTHQVLYWHNHQVGQFFAYHPDTKQWETLSTKTDVDGIEACVGTVMFYDPGQDALVLFGDVWSAAGTPQTLARPYMFVYRYPK